LQILELIIFAGLAAVVLFMLYTVLGRRVGRQPSDGFGAGRARQPEAQGPARVAAAPPSPESQMPGLAALKASDPGFELPKFLENARAAYEQIVKAFVGGDRETLKRLTAAPVFEVFEPEIARREAEGRSESVEFLQPPRADLEDAEVQGPLARLKVRFLAELRSRVRPQGGAEEQSTERRTAEFWTFERALDTQGAGWTLARVDSADA
jgi:predicted lipid-binding transport protein (Tim44 family)